jgi:hypothetical protein
MFWQEEHLIKNYFCKVMELVLDISFLNHHLNLFQAHIFQDQLDLFILFMLVIVHLILVLDLVILLYFGLLLRITAVVMLIFEGLIIVMHLNLVIEERLWEFKD